MHPHLQNRVVPRAQTHRLHATAAAKGCVEFMVFYAEAIKLHRNGTNPASVHCDPALRRDLAQPGENRPLAISCRRLSCRIYCHLAAHLLHQTSFPDDSSF